MKAGRRLDTVFEGLPAWVPSWARDWRKVLPGLAVVLVLALILALTPGSKPRQTSSLTSPSTSSAQTDNGAQATAHDNIVKPGAANASGGGTTAAGGPVAGIARGAGSGLGLGGGGATYAGVLDKTVLAGFTWQQAECGSFSGPAVAAAFGVPQPNDQEDIQAAIQFFESYPQVAFPGLPKDVLKGVSAKTGYWGRRVKAFLGDNGGPFCADKARAIAIQLAEQNHVFGTVQIPNDGSNEFIAPEMAARKRLDIGGPGFTRALYNRWEPYVYDITFSGSDVLEAWSSWACRDLWNHKSMNTGDVTTGNLKRVFGLVYPNDPIAIALSKEAKAALGKCGGSYAADIEYPTGIDQQPSAASNAIAQFKTKHVTTVLMLTDPLFAATLTSASTSQVFFPEWGVSSIGFNDIAFVVRHFYDQQQRKNVFGASHLSSSDRVPWSKTPQYHAWKLVRPNQEPPGGWNNWYLNIEILYAGMAGAGPKLTPQTFLAGLQKVCGPCGRTSKQAVYVAFGPHDTTGVDDFTLVKFNPNKEDVYDPPDEVGRKQIGYWDFPEKGLRYLRTIQHPEH